MRPLLSSAEARALDGRTRARYALPSLLLMERAALRLWDALEPWLEESGAGRESLLLAAAGKGGNGGDALALLRMASFAGYRRLAALILEPRLGAEAEAQAASLRAAGIPVLVWAEPGSAALLSEAGLILDGLFGTGLSAPLRGPVLELARAINASGAPVASIDLPSGFRDGMEAGEETIQAARTYSIEPAKAFLYAPAFREGAGDIVPVEGVFPRVPEPEAAKAPSPLVLLEDSDLPGLLPPLKPSLHKGERGRVAVAAGSPGMMGAALLSVRAAQAAGAGLVYLYLAEPLYRELALGSLTSELGGAILRPESELAGELPDMDAVLAGPGWGLDPDARAGRRKLLENLLAADKPLILDADGIRVLAGMGYEGTGRAGLMLTPHPGEFAALSGGESPKALANPAASLKEAVDRFNAVLVFKASQTWIAEPGGALSVWDGREPGLAVAGSGDVLAGISAGLAGRWAASCRACGFGPGDKVAWSGADGRTALFKAAQAAVVAHGRAGRIMRREYGWFQAAELIPPIGRMLGACP